MQHEITTPGPLLNEQGELNEVGYARRLIKTYSRTDIKAKKIRIKEWDYYMFYDSDYALCLTCDDNTYMGMISVSIIDFRNAKEKTVSPIKFFTNGKTNMPATSATGNSVLHIGKADISFIHDVERRILDCSMAKFDGKNDFVCHVELTEEPQDSMVIITPYKEDKKAFYYNQKIVGFKASGMFKTGNLIHDFSPASARGILDWGRGVWTYKNVWYWGAGTGIVDGHEVGFNIGYGFGDTTAASENVIFYDGILHKLSRLTFNIPQKDGKYLYTDAWTFTSDDGRFEMNFIPILDRASKTDIGIICSDQHQVFGKFSGTLVLDDGKKIELKDFIGFAERVYNKW